MKATAIAPSNIAFIKYWGKKDEILRLPENGSISMCLSNLLTTTTVEFSNDYKEDEIIFNNIKLGHAEFISASQIIKDPEITADWRDPADAGQVQDDKSKFKSDRIIKQLERIRKIAGKNIFAKVKSENNFPSSSGMASSASGFAALTLAGCRAMGLDLPEKELSILARLGSGSACRSIPDGFVEWLDGDTSETSFAVSLYSADYWKIVDMAAIVGEDKKEISSTEGQKLIKSNPFFQTRLTLIKNKIKEFKTALEKKDFTLFGEIMEAEALELHALFLTTNPPLIYWNSGTLKIIKNIQKWRKEGLETYLTIDAGPQAHIFCEEKNIGKVEEKLKEITEVTRAIVNKPSTGAKITDKHLF